MFYPVLLESRHYSDTAILLVPINFFKSQRMKVLIRTLAIYEDTLCTSCNIVRQIQSSHHPATSRFAPELFVDRMSLRCSLILRAGHGRTVRGRIDASHDGPIHKYVYEVKYNGGQFKPLEDFRPCQRKLSIEYVCISWLICVSHCTLPFSPTFVAAAGIPVTCPHQIPNCTWRNSIMKSQFPNRECYLVDFEDRFRDIEHTIPPPHPKPQMQETRTTHNIHVLDTTSLI